MSFASTLYSAILVTLLLLQLQLSHTLSSPRPVKAQIEAEAATFEAAEAKRKARSNTDIDVATLGKAVGAFGVAGVALGLVITAPFSNMISSGAIKADTTPKAAKASKEIVVKAEKVRVESAPKSMIGSPRKTAAPKGYDLDISTTAAAPAKTESSKTVGASLEERKAARREANAKVKAEAEAVKAEADTKKEEAKATAKAEADAKKAAVDAKKARSDGKKEESKAAAQAEADAKKTEADAKKAEADTITI